MSKTEFPSVSVIIVNFNKKRYLEFCLPSLIKLNYPSSRYEIILVDNNSNDGSLDYVQEAFPSINAIKLERNAGWVGGINVGAKHAKGEYLILLNNDIYVDKDWMIELVRSLNGESIEMCSSRNFLMDDHTMLDQAGCTNNIIGQGWGIGMLREYEGQYEKEYEITHPGGASCILKRRVYERFGYLLDPDYFMSQDDLDLGWRARLLGFKVVYAPKAVAYHKRGASSIVSYVSFYYSLRNMFVTYYKNLSKTNLHKVLPLVITNIFLTCVFQFIRSKDVNHLANFARIVHYMKENRRRIKEKRKQVQSLRKCSDKEIFCLFSTLMIVPEGMRKFNFLLQILLKLANLYVSVTGIPVRKFEGLYYY